MNERFADINHGQLHRARLIEHLANPSADPSENPEGFGEEDESVNHRRHHADNGGRAKGGGRGGRGGGFVGSRPRVSVAKRYVPVMMACRCR